MKNKPILQIDRFGNKYWTLKKVLHREDGPAVEYSNGAKEWRLNGKRHRLDGPAVQYNDGSPVWWVNNKDITKKIENWAQENDIDLDNLTTEDIALIKLFWG